MAAQVFDYEGLCERVGGRIDVIESLVDLLLSTYPGDRSGLQALVEQGNSTGFRELAHRLKGQLQTLGVDSAAQVALELELMGRDSRLDDAPAALVCLDDEMTRFREVIAEIRTTRG